MKIIFLCVLTLGIFVAMACQQSGFTHPALHFFIGGATCVIGQALTDLFT